MIIEKNPSSEHHDERKENRMRSVLAADTDPDVEINSVLGWDIRFESELLDTDGFPCSDHYHKRVGESAIRSQRWWTSHAANSVSIPATWTHASPQLAAVDFAIPKAVGVAVSPQKSDRKNKAHQTDMSEESSGSDIRCYGKKNKKEQARRGFQSSN